MAPQTLYDLIDKYIDGTASEQEKVLLEKYYERLDRKGTAYTLPSEKDALRDLMYQNIQQALMVTGVPETVPQDSSQPNGAKVVPLYRRPVFRIATAASVLFLVFSLWFLNRKSEVGGQKSDVAQVNDVPAPQGNRAMITLANGQVVYLDSADNGTLANESGVTLVKRADGKIEYQSTSQSINGSTAYNILTNPRGSKVIDMQLSDGSHVWLNAGSSIKYPVAFVGNERKVEMTGEAYFEVAPHPQPLPSGAGEGSRTGGKMPFIVAKGNMEVRVLGTHFNVNAYDDEGDVKVTLLEGSVRVKSEVGSQKSEKTIKPGEQAQINQSTNSPLQGGRGAINVVRADLEATMAWKNGLFSFNNASLQQVMKQLTRWYDVEVVYEGQPAQRQFVGEMQRTLSLSQVLKILEKNGVKFKIEGKKVTISN